MKRRLVLWVSRLLARRSLSLANRWLAWCGLGLRYYSHVSVYVNGVEMVEEEVDFR